MSKEIEAVVGSPYLLHGRGPPPEGFDCLGLVLWLYSRAYGVVLPDPIKSEKPVAAVRKFLGCFRTLNTRLIQSGDLIHAFRSSSEVYEQHLAVVESPEWAVEADYTGVRRVRPEDVSGGRVLYKRLRQRCWP